MYGSGLNSPANKIWDHFIISDDSFEIFQDGLTGEKINKLYIKLKEYENKGYVTYNNFFISMKYVFDEDLLKNENHDYNKINNINNYEDNLKSENSSNSSDIDKFKKSNSFDEIYDLIFKRFREIKCIIKNNKNIFYLTDFKKENYINSYNVVCALTIFLKTNFENKIKILFNLSDIDEDGFLNKKEIEHLITTINQLFGEEISTINTNSSILSQSLTNIKVKNILYEILYGHGELYKKLIEEKNYITFDMFYKSIKKIKNYKFRIIPCFISFRDCLFSHKKEKMININQKHKKDFINISSALILEQNKKISEYSFKKLSINNLNEIIKPIRINKNLYCTQRYIKKENNNNQLKNSNTHKYRRSIRNRKIFLKSDLSLKELIKNSTIFDEDENLETNKLSYSRFNNQNNMSKKRKKFQYAFEANFNDIRNIEVEPGIIKFISNEIQKNNDNNIINNNFINNNQKPKFLHMIPDIRKTNSNKIITNNERINKISGTLKKIIANNYNPINKNSNNNINNEVIKEYIKTPNKEFKKYRLLLHHQSFSTNNLFNFLEKHNRERHSNSTYFKKKKKFVFKNNNIINNKYKTLDEILEEIKNQEKKFNNDSAAYINHEIIKASKKLELDMKNYMENSTIFQENKNLVSHKFKTLKDINK